MAVNLRRMCAAAAGAALVAVTAAACTSHAGAAAQVGGSTISDSTLRGFAERGVVAVSTNPTAAGQLNTPDLQRKLLSLLITERLLEREASSLGVSVSPQDVDAYSQAAGAIEAGSLAKLTTQLGAAGLSAQDVPFYLRFGALQEAVEDKLSPAPAVSDATLRQQYDQVVAQYGALSLSFDAAKPWITRFMATDTRSTALANRLASLSHSTTVSVNPRFGTWDASQLGVEAADGSIATRIAPAPTSSPAGLAGQ
jgi:SurA N-terminal domain